MANNIDDILAEYRGVDMSLLQSSLDRMYGRKPAIPRPAAPPPTPTFGDALKSGLHSQMGAGRSARWVEGW